MPFPRYASGVYAPSNNAPLTGEQSPPGSSGGLHMDTTGRLLSSNVHCRSAPVGLQPPQYFLLD